ncbi:Gfo/Idh/MocA family protein [Kineosporia sp. R_H_3]|uniref:Gfo/Idh/MocA family protein n=1 Tax=Kineosporia sp. R_H_3 TaxID=1961848 RepID=UPI000B4C1F40|nr:Gfo/Idh/MocA family oxidoreductase [Kineosporia sp. R_H_3]
MTPLRVGVVGAGKISGQYAATLTGLPDVAVTAVADLDAARAQAFAAAVGGAAVRTLDDLLAADDVDVVLNLTVPVAHADVALAALAAGKHVYGEKPLAATGAQARAVVEAAATAGLRLGCAPDTVLGTGVQTARGVVTAGTIGVPHAATAFMTTPGHELWHPDPEFYYRPGGGPLLDMGPYYLTALVHLLGPVDRVVGLGSRHAGTRTIGSGPRAGTTFDVEVDTHVTGVLQHAGGALTTLVMSFDAWATRMPRIEVHGPGGSLSLPDPNYFDGTVEIFPAGADAWRDVRPSAGYVGAGRGIGVADLARGLADGTPHRASADVALHVLDVMESLLEAARTGEAETIGSTCSVPAAVPGLVDLRAC